MVQAEAVKVQAEVVAVMNQVEVAVMEAKLGLYISAKRSVNPQAIYSDQRFPGRNVNDALFI